MEEFDVVSGGFNIKKPANNPPNSENSISLKKTMNSTCFALTHNVVLRFSQFGQNGQSKLGLSLFFEKSLSQRRKLR